MVAIEVINIWLTGALYKNVFLDKMHMITKTSKCIKNIINCLIYELPLTSIAESIVENSAFSKHPLKVKYTTLVAIVQHASWRILVQVSHQQKA